MDRIHENQVGEILPCQFEPEPSTKTSDTSDDNDTDQSDVTTSSITTSLKVQMLGPFKILVGVYAVIAHYPLRLLNVFVAKRRRWSTSTKCKPHGANYMQYLSPTLYIKLIFHD